MCAEEKRTKNNTVGEMADEIITSSPEMQNLLSMVSKVANFNSTVLITGETGVGKEVIANLIHTGSVRRDRPFIKVNCTAIPENLLESELFGYKPGSFTGALKQGKTGVFEAADEGSLLLDEIGDLPISLQAKILRVLQEGEVLRIGGTKPVKVDVRVIAATNKNLERSVQEGRFREDLYYRLNVIPVFVAPLRQRKEEIVPLVKFFTGKYQAKFGLSQKWSPAALQLFLEYDWPGNVRELKNVVERILVMTSDKQVITPEVIIESDFLKGPLRPDTGKYVQVYRIGPLQKAVQELEIQMINMALREYSIKEAARILEVHPSTIWRKRQQHGC